MGYAISSFQEAFSTVLGKPKLLVGIGATSLLGTILYLFVSYIPLIGAFVAWIIPALMLAAVLTMAYEGLHGTPTFGHLTDGLEEHAVPMLGAFFALFAVYFAASIVLLIVVFALIFAGAMSVDPAAEAGADPAMFGALGMGILALLGIVFLVSLVVWIVIQFFDAAIVVGDTGVIDSFKASWGVVRSNPLSVIGYTLIRGVIGWIPIVIAGIAGGVGSLVGSADQSMMFALLFGFLAFVVTGPIVWTVLFVYHVSYFDQASGTRSRTHY